MKLSRILLAFCVTLLCISCDFIGPRKYFRLAVADSDYSYGYSGGHLKKVLENDGYTIDIIHCKNVTAAANLVATGQADLTMMMNQSTYVAQELGNDANQLRTVLPLFERVFFMYTRQTVPDTIMAAALFGGKRIGLESLQGETQKYLEKLFKSGGIDSATMVSENDHPDFVHFWGTYHGPRSTKLLKEGWHVLSLNPRWVEFMQLEDPALRPFNLPPLPNSHLKSDMQTVTSETLLVCNAKLGDNTMYHLANTIYQNKLVLSSLDNIYRHVREDFDPSFLLFPLHPGVDDYLRRDQPSFLERYAETIALFISLLALCYGGLSAFRNYSQSQKKERIDSYFLELLEIRSKRDLTTAEKTVQLNELLRRSIVQMTKERIDKMDFHIFSRLIQQEIALMR